MADYEAAGADMIIDEETVIGQVLAQKIGEHMQEVTGTALACGLAGQAPEDAA